ncbi:S1 family peptidase [Comamonas thiooxydans]|uniref:S1 family peptidase n=1 Tax=Comamonas thiooxydans TaxID=363952 RepID=UPI0009ED8AB4|nr:serine protease [Comamonas thiooxydans]
MLTFNVYDRVFFVRGVDYGTAFTIDVDQRQYLVSAKHVVGNKAEDVAALKIFMNKTWKDIPVDFVGSGNGEVDITVVAPKERLSPPHPLEPTTAGIVLSQDVFFVGYPYKMWANGGEVMGGRPLPFIKKGTLSAAFNPDENAHFLYVDAINNEGFSGGPILFAPPNTSEYKVAGVVSKFKTEYENVLDERGEPTGHTVVYNTGFLIGCSIKYAVDIIKNNPIGLFLE